MEFKGKTVIITGASRGIGAEAARVFAAAGANVALLARSADSLEALAAEIGENALALACDVSDYASVEAAVQKTVERFGGLDVLINNAGVLKPIGPLAEVDPDEWGQVIDINIKGVFNGMRAALPVMKAAGGGSVLTVSSGAAHNPLEGWGAYCTSKAGAAVLTRSLDLEERSNGIRAIGLSPGTVATQMQRDIKASGVNRISEMSWEDHVPADWPAKILLWMCTPDADEFIGSEISQRDEEVRKRSGLT